MDLFDRIYELDRILRRARGGGSRPSRIGSSRVSSPSQERTEAPCPKVCLTGVHAVRRGQTVVVLDRKEPVARIVPIARDRRALPTRRATRSLRDLVLPSPLPGKVDSLAALLEDRRGRRFRHRR